MNARYPLYRALWVLGFPNRVCKILKVDPVGRKARYREVRQMPHECRAMVQFTSPTEKAKARPTDVWVPASWDEFLACAEDSAYEECRLYFDRALMRIEMVPLGSSHSQDDPLVARVISFFATLNGLRFKEISNGSFRKLAEQGCQPDIAFYIGPTVSFPPRGNAPIDLNQVDPPTLVVEISSTTLSDDLGPKRLLYERLGVTEYWVVDVNLGTVTAFEIAEGRSGEIQESDVLPGLKLEIVEQALQLGLTEDDGMINRWLLETFGLNM